MCVTTRHTCNGASVIPFDTFHLLSNRLTMMSVSNFLIIKKFSFLLYILTLIINSCLRNNMTCHKNILNHLYNTSILLIGLFFFFAFLHSQNQHPGYGNWEQSLPPQSSSHQVPSSHGFFLPPTTFRAGISPMCGGSSMP